MKIIKAGPFPIGAERTTEQWGEIFNASKALVEKMAALERRDGHVGFDEWCRLVDALNATGEGNPA